MQVRRIAAFFLVIAVSVLPLAAAQETYTFSVPGGAAKPIEGVSLEPKTPIVVVRPNSTVETTFLVKNAGNRTVNLTLSTMSTSSGGGSTYTIGHAPGNGTSSGSSNPPPGSGNGTVYESRSGSGNGSVEAESGNGTASRGPFIYSSAPIGAFKPTLEATVSPQNVTVPPGETLEVRVRLTADASATGDQQVVLTAREMEEPDKSVSGSLSVKIPKASTPTSGTNDSRRSTLLDDEPAATPFPGAAALVGVGGVALALRRAGGRR